MMKMSKNKKKCLIKRETGIARTWGVHKGSTKELNEGGSSFCSTCITEMSNWWRGNSVSSQHINRLQDLGPWGTDVKIFSQIPEGSGYSRGTKTSMVLINNSFKKSNLHALRLSQIFDLYRPWWWNPNVEGQTIPWLPSTRIKHSPHQTQTRYWDEP